MCGIAGFQSKEEKNRQKVIGSMLDVIRHRGPDDKGEVHIDDVSLGHVRLAIVDIEHGKQPMISPDGRYSLVFNGEIYNHFELRQLLGSKGYRLMTHSDSEVLLYLYIEYGEKVLNYLNGMFAFAVYDNKEKLIFLARDQFGIKPLYYFQKENTFVFASEIKSLLHFPQIEAAVDDESLYDYLTFQMMIKEKTLFRNIYKVESAHYLIVRRGKIIANKEYWQLPYKIDSVKEIERYADEILVLLENSLSLQVRSDVPVGIYLSGGFDSSIVTTLASKNYAGQLKTFTGGFKKEGYDETGYARIVSKYNNTTHYEVFPKPTDFIDNFEKIVYFMDEPEGGPGIFSQYMVSQLASQHVKVILGGQGADEVFGGYARYLVAYLEQCIKGAIFETQEEGQHIVTLHSIIPNLSLLKQYTPMIKNQFSAGLFDDMDRRYFKLIDRSPLLCRMYAAEFLEARNADRIFEKFHSIFNKPDTQSYLNKMTYFDFKTLLPALLHIEDRVGMAASIESRVPFLDKRIVELVAKIPPAIKFAGGKTKAILLHAVKNILPKEIIERKDKMGFPTPLNEWFSSSLKNFVLDIFFSKKTKSRGIFNTQSIEKIVFEEGKFNRDIWGALNIEMWFRTFID